MELVFVCPERHQTFNCSKFEIIENHGIITDSVGNKTLDVSVRLTEPCPFCGKRHVYPAGELSCPLFESD